MSAINSRLRAVARTALVTVLGVAMLMGLSVAAGVAAPASALAATTATATTATSTLELTDSGTAAKTSNGVAWTLIVGWDEFDSAEPANMSVGLERPVTTGGTGEEIHVWSFNVTAATLAFDAGTGAGTLDTGTQASPVATVDLAFKATSHKAATCTTGSETVYSGTLSGKLSLVTGLTGGGTVGGTSLSFTVATPEILVDSSCIVAVNDCTADTLFVSGDVVTTTLASGLSETMSGKTVDFVGVEKQTTLKSPTGATRIDAAELDAAPATYDATTKVLSVTTSSAGLVTGSATLSGGTVKTETSPCTFAGKKYKVKSTLSQNADYASPAGHLISAKTSLSGTLSGPASSKTALFEVVTVKAA